MGFGVRNGRSEHWIASVQLDNVVFPSLISGTEIENESRITVKIRFSCCGRKNFSPSFLVHLPN